MAPRLLLSLLAATLPAGAAGSDIIRPAALAPYAVEIRQMRFDPPVLTVPVGTMVIWLNEDGSPHTVADRGKAFRSAALDTNERFSYTFTTPGEFSYFCTLHPMMIGKIVVRASGPS